MKRLFAPSILVAALVAAPAVAQPPSAEPPIPRAAVTVDVDVTETPSKTVTTTTEVIEPVSGRGGLDAENPIAPEVKAVVAANANYTTADLVKAQHEAMLATPASLPTTIIQTTTTAPKPGG